MKQSQSISGVTTLKDLFLLDMLNLLTDLGFVLGFISVLSMGRLSVQISNLDGKNKTKHTFV